MAYDKPNYTQAPNLFFDQHLPKIRSLAELKVTLVVIRYTLGWHEKEAELTIADLMKLTGLSNRHVIRGAALALERGTVCRRAVKCPSGETFAYEANIASRRGMTKGHSSHPEAVTFSSTNGHSLGASPINVLKKLNKPRKRGSADDGPKFGVEMIRHLPDEWMAEQRTALKQKYPDLNFDYYHDKWCLSRFSNGGIGRGRRHTGTLNQFAADLELYFANCEENRIDRAGRGGNGSGNQKPVWMAPDR